MDSRFRAFAKTIVGWSTNVRPGEIVYIDTMDLTPIEMVLAIAEAVTEAGGFPYCIRRNERLVRYMAKSNSDDLFKFMAKMDLNMIRHAGKGIIFRDIGNMFFLHDVPGEAIQKFSRLYSGRVIQQRAAMDNWLFSRWPTLTMANMFQMSSEELENLFFKSVLLDYEAMDKACLPLQKLMQRADIVRIVGPGDTDLKFSIKDIPVIRCTGKLNMPDGECFSAPVRNSVNGVIEYNTRVISHTSRVFEGLRFVFRNGKIVEATCQIGEEAELNKILDTDKGARYIGEFALGFNPYITKTFGEVLFDEKVAGSFHFTPGKAYPNAYNGNRSAIHWDIVCDQTPDMGGGEIYFDGKLIRRDGLFVPKCLQRLNPENLLAA